MKKIFILLFSFMSVYQCSAQLTVLPVFGDKPIMEDTWFVSKNGDSIQFDNIRFYLSDIQLEMDDKTVITDSVKAHLVDVFEPNTFQIAFPKVDYKHVKTLRFNIGIDSLTNVSGALNGDLDPQRGMYWAWQSGYINLKIEGKSPQSKNRKNVFQYHIGGYLPPFYAIRHIEINCIQIDGVILNHPVNNTVQNPTSDIKNPKYTEGSLLKINFSKFFDAIHIASQNSIMMPCKEAVQLADLSVQMFSIQTHEK
jgi:hypothetical protein